MVQLGVVMELGSTDDFCGVDCDDCFVVFAKSSVWLCHQRNSSRDDSLVADATPTIFQKHLRVWKTTPAKSSVLHAGGVGREPA